MSRLTVPYVRFLRRFRVAILLAWLLVTVVAAILAPRFITACSNAMDAPVGSRSYHDFNLLEGYFGDKIDEALLAILLDTKDGTSIIEGDTYDTVYTDEPSVNSTRAEQVRRFEFRLTETVAQWQIDGCTTLDKPPAELLAMNLSESIDRGEKSCLREVLGYFGLKQRGFYTVALASTLSSNHSAMVIEIELSVSQRSDAAVDFSSRLIDALPTMRNEAGLHDDQVRAVVVGMPAAVNVIRESAMRDLQIMDSIAIPCALLILGYVLRSLRLLILPLIAIAISTSISFAVMYAVSSFLKILSITPSLMTSLLVALSIDYSLFLCSRYREEILRGKAHAAAVTSSIAHAGHTIAVSGATLAACFLALIAFPLDILRSLGIGATTVVIGSVIVNLTVIPTLLLTAPKFFENAMKPFKVWGKWYIRWGCVTTKGGEGGGGAGAGGGGAKVGSIGGGGGGGFGDVGGGTAMNDLTDDVPQIIEFISGSGNNGADFEFDSGGGGGGVEDEDNTVSRNRIWLSLGYLLQTFPVNLLVVGAIVAGAVPMGQYALKFQTSASMEQLLPVATPLGDAMSRMSDEFGFGSIMPLRLLMIPPADFPDDRAWLHDEYGGGGDDDMGPFGNITAHIPSFEFENGTVVGFQNRSNGVEYMCDGCGRVLTNWFFKESAGIINRLAELTPHTNRSDFAGISYLRGFGGITMFEAMYFGQCFSRDGPIEMFKMFCSMFQFSKDLFVDDNEEVAWFQIGLPFNPLSVEGKQWVYDIRASMDNVQKERPGWQLSVTGISVVTTDSQDTVYDMLPEMCGVTGAVVLVFLAVAFRSFLIAVHSVATITLTLAYVYGLMSLVYTSPGIMMWFPLRSLHPPGNAVPGQVYWLNIIICFSIVVGFALDYQIFVLTRIKELRAARFSTRGAVANGVAHTGGVVTAAGIIMAMAFGGLLFSNVPVMGEIACVLVSGVLFDTFVVRTLLMPAMMSFFGDANWAPIRMPAVLVKDEGDEWQRRLRWFQVSTLCRNNCGGGGGGRRKASSSSSYRYLLELEEN